MAEVQTTEAGNEAAEPTKSRSSLINKLLIVAFMAGIVGVECAIAYFLIPDAEQVAEIAERKMAARLPKSLSDEQAGSEGSTRDTVEINLGEYSVTVTQPISTTTLRVDFKLVGTLLEEDEEEVTAAFDRQVHRFRDQILFEIRNSEPADLADPGLGLIKRRILEKSTNVFGKPLLKSVVFSQFSYVEQ